MLIQFIGCTHESVADDHIPGSIQRIIVLADAGGIQRSDICRVKGLIYNAASSVASVGKKNNRTQVSSDLQRCWECWEFTLQSCAGASGRSKLN